MDAPTVAARPCHLPLPCDLSARQTRRIAAGGRLACAILLCALAPTLAWSVVVQDITPWPDARIHQIRLSPDGRWLATLVSRGETQANYLPSDRVSVCVLEMGDEWHAVHPVQEPDPELEWPRSVYGLLHWSPDSSQLMYTLAPSGPDGVPTTAMVIDTETGATTSAGEYFHRVPGERMRPFWVGDEGHETGLVARTEVYAREAVARVAGAGRPGRPGSPFVVMDNSLWLRPNGGREAYLFAPGEQRDFGRSTSAHAGSQTNRGGLAGTFAGIHVAPNGLVAAVQGVHGGGRGMCLVDGDSLQMADVPIPKDEVPVLLNMLWGPGNRYIVYRCRRQTGSEGLWIAHMPEEWHE
jgi:hypothetical protein